MSDRDKWMPTVEAMDKAWRADFIVPINSGKPNIAALTLNSGLRAQCTVLEEMRAEFRSHLGTECLLRNAEARYSYELLGRKLEELLGKVGND